MELSRRPGHREPGNRRPALTVMTRANVEARVERSHHMVIDGMVIDGMVIDGMVIDGMVIDEMVIDGMVIDGMVIEGIIMDRPRLASAVTVASTLRVSPRPGVPPVCGWRPP